VSYGGVRLYCRREIPAGSALQLTFEDSECGLHFLLPGAVVWTTWNDLGQSYEMGIQFRKLTYVQQKCVLSLIGCRGKDGSREKRRTMRISVKEHVLVELVAPGRLLSHKILGELADISLGGMAVRAEKKPEQGGTCRARMFFSSKAVTEVAASVLDVRPGAGGAAWLTRLRFDEFSGDSRREIGQFISAEVQRAIG